ncbi:hypothetical protein Tco_0108217, partial [Tanacetum coccineum]
MKRAGKDFSGRITPLFDTMMVQPVEDIGEDSDHPTDSTSIPIIDQPSLSFQPKKDKSSKKAQTQEAEAKDAQAKEIAALKKRIQIVESSEDQESLGVLEDASKQGRSIEDIDADVDVSLVVEMHVEAKVDGKDEQSTKTDDNTAGDDSAIPTTNEEITLAQTLIQIKAA